MINVLVTGSSGQLGMCLKHIVTEYPFCSTTFMDKEQLDVTIPANTKSVFRHRTPDFVVNCAAYTNVEEAEVNRDRAYNVNAYAPAYLAKLCDEFNTTLIHISTDHVFDGEKKRPYTENCITNPISVYGSSKLLGEDNCLKFCKKTYIIRTSWLYSPYSKNFLTNTLELAIKKEKLNVVDDQFGSPTNAYDLAHAILTIIQSVHLGKEKPPVGIYHFTNSGTTNWYEFAKYAINKSNLNCSINPISSKKYSALARRPLYSILNKSKIKDTFSIETINWRQRLDDCLRKIAGKTLKTT